MVKFDIQARTKKDLLHTMREIVSTKIVLTIHRDERVPINKAIRLVREGRTTIRWMIMGMARRYRIQLISTLRITESTVMERLLTCRFKSRTLIQIRLQRCIRLIAQWLPTTRCTATTSTSLSRTLASTECLQAKPISRAAAAHCSHIARCSTHRERTQIFKPQWTKRTTTLKIIKGIREEDRRMLTNVKERASSRTNKIWWRWVSCQSIINNHPLNRRKEETSRLHVTEKLSTRARSTKKSIVNNSWTKALKSIQTWKLEILEKEDKPINNLIKLTSIWVHLASKFIMEEVAIIRRFMDIDIQWEIQLIYRTWWRRKVRCIRSIIVRLVHLMETTTISTMRMIAITNNRFKLKQWLQIINRQNINKF